MRGWRPLALTTRWHGSTLRPSFVDTLWGGVGARKPCNFFENGDKIGISGILCFSRNGVFLIQQPEGPQRNGDSVTVFDVVFHDVAIGDILYLLRAFLFPSHLEGVLSDDKV